MEQVAFEAVAQYIDENILHSKQWDACDDVKKNKAVNNARKKLESLLKVEIEQGYQLTDEDIALQAVWMLRVDDSVQRAEMGATYLAVDGIMMMFKEKDNTLSPEIANKFGLALSHGIRRKAGRYIVGHSTNYRVPISNSKKLETQRLHDS